MDLTLKNPAISCDACVDIMGTGKTEAVSAPKELFVPAKRKLQDLYPEDGAKSGDGE